MKKETYIIAVEIRNENGKIIKNKNNINIPEIRFEITVSSKMQLEYMLKDYYRTFIAFLPNHKIEITASVFHGVDEFSRSLMAIAVARDEEKVIFLS